MDKTKAEGVKRAKMSFNSLRQTYQKLAKNPELSQHNKEVLEHTLEVLSLVHQERRKRI